VHLVYVLLFCIYTNQVYNERNFENRHILCWMLLICLMYPMTYDMLQLKKQGIAEYFSDKWNFLDQGHIWIGIANVLVQRLQPNILSKESQILMLISTILLLIKTFFFLRIFEDLSFLVTMVKQVFLDLRVFLLFFAILLLMFGIVFSVLDLRQYSFSDDPDVRAVALESSYSGQEFVKINKFVANMLAVYRISLGDFDFGASIVLDDFQNALFWLFWTLIVTVTCIVFLNFIIAEVGASYSNVKENVDLFVKQEKGTLINESEDMIRARFGADVICKWNHIFPKYLIVREEDE